MAIGGGIAGTAGARELPQHRVIASAAGRRLQTACARDEQHQENGVLRGGIDVGQLRHNRWFFLVFLQSSAAPIGRARGKIKASYTLEPRRRWTPTYRLLSPSRGSSIRRISKSSIARLDRARGGNVNIYPISEHALYLVLFISNAGGW